MKVKIALIIMFLFPLSLIAQQYKEVINVQGNSCDQFISVNRQLVSETNSESISVQSGFRENHFNFDGTTQIDWLVNNVPVKMTIYYTVEAQCNDSGYNYSIFSSGITDPQKQRFTYEELKNLTTAEGLAAFYKSRGIPPLMISKKKFSENIQYNRELTGKIENRLQEILYGLTKSMKKDLAAF